MNPIRGSLDLSYFRFGDTVSVMDAGLSTLFLLESPTEATEIEGHTFRVRHTTR